LRAPFGGLAPLIVQDLLAVCRRLAEEGRTILIVEQNVQAALLLARRCCILNNGHVVYEGTPAELRHDPDFMHGHLGV
jgi:branched-chain amino acid transport system ATP-binding protein